MTNVLFKKDIILFDLFLFKIHIKVHLYAIFRMKINHLVVIEMVKGQKYLFVMVFGGYKTINFIDGVWWLQGYKLHRAENPIT